MIRNTIESDLLEIKSIVAKTERLMKASGNINQWVDGYPSSEVLLSDIRSMKCYLYYFMQLLLICNEVGQILHTTSLQKETD